MKSQEFIDLEVSLLLLKYGPRAVLRAVASHSNLSEEALRIELDRIRRSQYLLTTKKKVVSRFEITSLFDGSEEKEALLNKLFSRYENRTFLPELKDVRLFFERHGKPYSKWKSRDVAKAYVFKFIATLPVSDMKKFLEDSPVDNETSALGMIADEILGRKKADSK